jgi:hypothetical protein
LWVVVDQKEREEKDDRCSSSRKRAEGAGKLKSALPDHDDGRALRYHDGDDNRPLRKAPQSNGTMRFDRP